MSFANGDLTCDAEDKIAKLFSELYKKSHLSNFVVRKNLFSFLSNKLEQQILVCTKTVTSSLARNNHLDAEKWKWKQVHCEDKAREEKSNFLVISCWCVWMPRARRYIDGPELPTTDQQTATALPLELSSIDYLTKYFTNQCVLSPLPPPCDKY